MMEIELEPRVKPLGYKVKGMSRESPSQKAAHVLETDLRTHWSTGTNTKEWILLELDEPCLLSHIRIYNKSVLEWEIAVGLRYKPETFVKVRPRCEAPRRDMIYPMNYASCRYVRISCLRGNPIAIFFIQLIGISVTGLEPEFQPIVNHLMPSIIANKQETDDMHLRLLQDITSRLLVFIPQLEAELTSFSDDADQKLRFFAMLVGPLYPILHIVNERERAKSLGNASEFEVPKNNQLSSSLTVSSNFEPRRSRSASPFISSTYSAMVFRPDLVFMLLRKAYKESDLATVCRLASRILHKLIEPVSFQDTSTPANELTSVLDETPKSELSGSVSVVDYSSLFGDEFRTSEDHWDLRILTVLDMGAVEEGILHVLYACASQPLLCHKLAESSSDLWSALPLIQALLPALRPAGSNHGDHVDDNFSQWKQPFVQQALSQIVATSCSGLYCPLLHSCAGYLSSFSPSHAKSACVLIDLCSGVLAPWMAQVIAKVDLTVELLEDLLGTIQNARHSLSCARAALKYIVLALSGHMDDILWKYKEVKHKVLFLVEMLEPFLDPAIYASKSTIAFGDVSFTFSEKQEHTCVIALNIIRTAVQKPAVLPSLESEWRRGSVAPSVLLSILEPQMQLPPDIDLCKSPDVKNLENKTEEVNRKADVVDTSGKMDTPEDVSLLFAPSELRTILLTNVSVSPTELVYESNHGAADSELKDVIGKKFPCLSQNGLVLDTGLSAEYLSLQADYFQLMNYRDCELRASEFQRLALDLHSQDEIAVEGHDAAIDALLLAAECYVNPFFALSFGSSPKLISPTNCTQTKGAKVYEISDLRYAPKKTSADLETVSFLEKKRDKIVLQLLLEAAELNQKYQKRLSGGDNVPCYHEGTDEQILSLSPVGVQSADAVTLVRQNQALLCTFLIQRLKNTQHSVHEILMHCLVFLLHSATQLYCHPEDVLDIILGSAEYLTGMLISCYDQLKEGNLLLNQEKVHGLQRRWILLKRLVIASSGGEGSDFSFNVKNGFRCGNLIPSSAWMQKISTFSSSSSPLVRFLGWMAVSRNAKQYIKERLFLASDLSQLTYLLSIFADELVLMDNVVKQRHEDGKIEYSGPKQNSPGHQVFQPVEQQYGDQSFHIIYPHLSKFFPNLKEQFESFGENILEAVGLQLRSLSYSAVPDILCWFSDLCSWPFFQDNQFNYPNNFDHRKGHVAKNAKAVILYILEAILTEHMEAMVPEIPRVVQVLVTLCGASYCDVSFLDSVMQLLRPIISYSLCKASDDEKELAYDDSCLNFEALCFEELFANIRQKSENQDAFKPSDYNRSLTIFTLASLFADLSFQRRREILQSLILWADFTAFEPTTTFHDYLCAFQVVLDSCKTLLIQTLRAFGALPLHSSNSSDSTSESFDENSLVINSSFLSGLDSNSYPCQISEKVESIATKQRDYSLPAEEIEEFSKNLEDLLAKLNPTIELCWNLHHLLAKKLAVTSAQCFSYLRCLCSVVPQVQNVEENVSDYSVHIKPVDQFLFHWRMGLEGLSELIIKLQDNNCWEVASLMLDCLLGVPGCCRLHNIVHATCCAIKGCSSNAPKISWRLQSDKWLSMLLPTDIQGLQESDGPVADLFVTLLGHPEPEQRFIALQHLGRLVGQDINGQLVLESSMICDKLLSPDLVDSVPEQSLSLLVSSTWDRVVLLASSDTFLPLRTRSMALLIGYIPHAARHHLQSFLVALDNVLPGLGKVPYPTCEGPLLRLSLALIAVACLYSPAEDVSLISRDVWRNIEKIGSSKNEGKFGDLEKNACKVLCGLRTEGDEAKKVLKEVLSSTPSKQVDPEFGSTRESILQVLANLTSVQSYFEFFSQKIDQEAMELEEAEIELDLLEKEYAVQESLKDSKEEELRFVAASAKDDNRLQQIKDRINTLDKSKLQEEIVARRQKKLLMRRARQKYLDEAALREEKLLLELDREKTAEAEKEIERQQLLELERAKTRELRHNLDMEKERQTQRELQRELEQAESGLRSSRREFSSTHSRPRDRYRERENGRSSNEGSARTTSGSLQPDISTSNSSMAISNVLSGSRSFSGQPPMILQSRDRLDDCGSSYEENFDGSRDSGDTGSIGDPELVSAFDGQSSGYGSGQRHGSRGSKSRQVTERREREGRREGKWERKH